MGVKKTVKEKGLTSREVLEVYWRLKDEYGPWVPREVLTRATGGGGSINYLISRGKLEKRTYGGKVYVKASWIRGEWPPRVAPEVVGYNIRERVKMAEEQLLTISRMAEKYARIIASSKEVPAKDLMASYEALRTLVNAYELLVKDTVYLAKKGGLV